MKKIISVVLAALLAFSALAVAASAEGGEYQTYYIKLQEQNDQLHIVPLPGYSQYVKAGEDFKFTIEVDEGYTQTFTVTDVDHERIEPDVHGVYTISNIQSDKVISVYFTMETGASNLFSSLIAFLRNLGLWFRNIIDSILKGIQT